MNLSVFEREVLEKLKKVPKGRVTTYSALARAVGKPKATRAVGNAVHKNPWAPKVPCHRVVKASGELGGFASSPRKKTALLKKEGVIVKKGKIKDFNLILNKF